MKKIKYLYHTSASVNDIHVPSNDSTSSDELQLRGMIDVEIVLVETKYIYN
jgi:hypothetical protein